MSYGGSEQSLLQSKRKKAMRYAKFQFVRNARVYFFVFGILFLTGLMLIISNMPAGYQNRLKTAPSNSKSQHQTTVTTSKRAYATLLVGTQSSSQKTYAGTLVMWVANLRHFHVTDDIVVMVTSDVKKSVIRVVESLDVKIKMVDRLSSTGSYEGYAPMLTKIALWSLTDYEQIAYYDSDHLYLNTPEHVFDECGRNSFCAVQDPGIPWQYFNAGFMLLRPDVSVYHSLYAQRDLANGKGMAEQDFLNDVFKESWKPLEAKHNIMLVTRDKLEKANAVAVHEKWWNLRNKHKLTEPTWIWNQLLTKITFTSNFEFSFVDFSEYK
jgi:alpha-N-acetylglucosamine transferase